MWISLTVIASLVVSNVLGALVTDQLKWSNFKTKYGKTYQSSNQEEERFKIFQDNLRTIESHNALYEAGKKTFRMGINQFTDMSKEEYRNTLNRQQVSNPEYDSMEAELPDVDIPDSIDWRDKGAVTKVKNQGNCGSCWAFATTASIESFYFLENKELVDLSPQQLVDCETDVHGCDGGSKALAMGYIQENGIAKEESYPYKGDEETCHYNESIVFTKISGYVKVAKNDEDSMVKVVASLGPISVSLDATDMQHYETGILEHSECVDMQTNHAVLAVGYGHDNKTNLDYWIVKNSWGELWGEDGYFKIKRGTNECGIALKAVFPIL